MLNDPMALSYTYANLRRFMYNNTYGLFAISYHHAVRPNS